MSQDKRQTHLGWTNYETWCVSQWLPTDQSTWETFREQMRREVAKCAANGDQRGHSSTSTRSMLRFRLAKRLRVAVERLDYTDLPLIYCDLLESALTSVNWPEVVEYFLANPFPNAAHRSPQPVAGSGPLFDAGRIATAPAAQAALTREDVQAALARHVQGDWGILDAQNRRQNVRALAAGLPLQSVYELKSGTIVWVVTEADRSLTNVLLAEDY